MQLLISAWDTCFLHQSPQMLLQKSPIGRLGNYIFLALARTGQSLILAYTKFHLPRPVFHSPSQIFTCIGARPSAIMGMSENWLCYFQRFFFFLWLQIKFSLIQFGNLLHTVAEEQQIHASQPVNIVVWEICKQQKESMLYIIFNGGKLKWNVNSTFTYVFTDYSDECRGAIEL